MTNRQAAIQIIKTLRKEGFCALLAGGCVRDMLLGRVAKDYDVVTDARPQEIIKLFRRTLKIGAKFGVVMVMIHKQKIEVATFRTEYGYADGRHPGNVKFSDAKNDAVRRDFTINGMFYDFAAKKVIDHVGGQADLQNRLIRTIGNASERFGEDYLRMLRAVRFSTQLGFVIEKKTFKAICRHAPKIIRISGERISMELEAILSNPNRANGASMLLESSLAEAIFKGFTTADAKFGICVLRYLRKRIDFPLALTSLFARCETGSVMERCATLKLSRAHRKHLRFLLTHRQRLLDVEMGLADLKLLLSEPYFWDLYEFQKAIQKANAETIKPLTEIKKRAQALKGKDLRPKPLLNGHELIALGVQSGPMVGLVCEEMYIAQLGEKINTRDQARSWVARWLKKHKRVE
jgi:poly(A) polymerase